MPNVAEMSARMSSHLARVSGKAMGRELDRIQSLRSSGKVSPTTASYMIQSAAVRLAWLANAA